MSCAVTRVRSDISTASPNVTAKAGEYFREQLRHVEVALKIDEALWMGDQFTSADIRFTTCLEWAIAYNVGICDNAHPYPNASKTRPGYLRGNAMNVPPAPGEPVRTASGLINNTSNKNALLAGHFLISTIASPERPLKRRMSDAVYLGMRTALFATI